MSKFTKDQLIKTANAEIAEWSRALERNPDNPKYHQWLKLAEIALAALTAEPVAYMYKDNLHADARFSLHTRFGNWSQEDINEYEITEIPLYTAPPAPVVPDDRQSFELWYSANCGLSGADLESEFNRNDDGEYIYSGAADAWKAWKASRAAMLQGAKKVVKHEAD